MENNEFKLPGSRVISLISAFGLLILLIGYIFFLKKGYDLREENKETRDSLDRSSLELASLNNAKDSVRAVMALYKDSITLFQNTANTFREALEEKNPVVREKIINSGNSEQNTLKTQLSIKQAMLDTISQPALLVQSAIKTPQNIVYIQVYDDATLELVKKMDLSAKLSNSEFMAYGYEKVPGVKPYNCIKYFHEADADAAKRLQDKVVEVMGVKSVLLFINSDISKKVPDGQLELWLIKR